jgi:hypothetical protein
LVRFPAGVGCDDAVTEAVPVTGPNMLAPPVTETINGPEKFRGALAPPLDLDTVTPSGPTLPEALVKGPEYFELLFPRLPQINPWKICAEPPPLNPANPPPERNVLT